VTTQDRFAAAVAGDEAALLSFFQPTEADEGLDPGQLEALVEAAIVHRRHAVVQHVVAFLDLPEAAQALMPIVRRLAERGEPVAHYVIGWSHIGRDEEAEGFRWIERAAAGGYPPALVNLAQLRMAKDDATTEDYEAGLQLLQRAVELDDPHAKYLYGVMLFRGAATGRREAIRGSRLVEQAMQQGFERAAEQMAAWQADPEALFFLGLAYINGDQMEPDLHGGFAMLVEAAQHDFQPAQDAMAQLVLAGMVTPNDPRAFAPMLKGGLARIREAAQAGEPLAQTLLGHLEAL
jgi:TPR repeat protein